MQKSLGKGSAWIVHSANNHTISISKYKPLVKSSFNKITKRIKPFKKRLD